MLYRLLGTVLLLFVATDVFCTVLLPSARGVLTGVWSQALWRAASVPPGRLGLRARQAAGPLSLISTIATWVLLLWVGFALLYLPVLSTLAYSSDVRFEGSDLATALYFSGTALTTLGLGDIAAQDDGVRLTVVLQAASGLALFTASLGYLPALYTVITELRTSAEAISDLRATTPERAARLLSEDAGMTLESVRRDVIAARQHLLRFPVLHYFRPPLGQSVLGVVEGATMLWVVARFGLSGEHHAGVARQAAALELALSRLVDDGARHVGDAGHGDGLGAAREQVEAVRAAVRDLDDWQHADGDLDDDALHDLARTNAVMTRYAAKHGYDFPTFHSC